MGLLELPQEIRDEILSYALADPSKQKVVVGYKSIMDRKESHTLPALCFVSKQLRADCLPIFYSINTFLIDTRNLECFLVAEKWLLAIGETGLKSLRHLEVESLSRVELGSKLFIHVYFDLKEGAARHYYHQGDIRIAGILFDRLQAWMQHFRESVKSRGGAPFSMEQLEDLLLDFHDLCQNGQFRDVDTRLPRQMLDVPQPEAAKRHDAGKRR